MIYIEYIDDKYIEYIDEMIYIEYLKWYIGYVLQYFYTCLSIFNDNIIIITLISITMKKFC